MTIDITIATPSWLDGAVCASTDPAVFMPEKGGSNAAAKMVCGVCPVTAACLSYALAEEIPFGVWGGTSPRERWPMQRALKAAS